LLPAVVGAETITVKFSGSRVVDVVASPTMKLSDHAPQAGPTVKVEASGVQWVRVYDPETGNLAARKASDLNGKSRSADLKNEWTVFKTDYNRIGELRVRADQGGKGLSLGSISIADQTQLLTEENRGTAAFYGVPVGKVPVAVSYREGSETRSVKQEFVVPAERDLPKPELIVALPAANEAATEAVDDRKLPPPKPPAVPTGMLGNLVAMLLAAGGALALLYFGLRWIYGNQDRAKDALTKLGVQVPDPVADPDPTPSPAADPFPASVPVTPILLDPVPVAAPVTVGDPMLVGPGGSFAIAEGVSIVGREAGLTIALTAESTVSRRHAEIVRNGDSMILRDLGSRNGTFVNGAPLAGDHALRRGDRVQFGSVSFEVK